MPLLFAFVWNYTSHYFSLTDLAFPFSMHAVWALPALKSALNPTGNIGHIFLYVSRVHYLLFYVVLRVYYYNLYLYYHHNLRLLTAIPMVD